MIKLKQECWIVEGHPDSSLFWRSNEYWNRDIDVAMEMESLIESVHRQYRLSIW